MQTLKTILVLAILIIAAAIAIAEPYGPDGITKGPSERRTSFGGDPTAVNAQAGNITQLLINTSVITKRWQGYYGNITGTITLDDANGHTMYDWSANDFSVAGKVFAANNTVSNWTAVRCVNLTGNGTIGPTGVQPGVNSTILENTFGIARTDADGFDETFATTNDITVGTNTLANCPSTHLYIANASQTTKFNETILTLYNESLIIFAAQLEPSITGFDNRTWDFEMIVANNGDSGILTPYQFYVELT